MVELQLCECADAAGVLISIHRGADDIMVTAAQAMTCKHVSNPTLAMLHMHWQLICDVSACEAGFLAAQHAFRYLHAAPASSAITHESAHCRQLMAQDLVEQS